MGLFKKESVKEYSKNHMFPGEMRKINATLIVKDGVDWAVSGVVPGEMINELDDLLEKMARYIEEN